MFNFPQRSRHPFPIILVLLLTVALVGCNEALTEHSGEALKNNNTTGSELRTAPSTTMSASSGGFYLDGYTRNTPQIVLNVVEDTVVFQFSNDTITFLTVEPEITGSPRDGFEPGGTVHISLFNKVTGETKSAGSVDASGPEMAEAVDIENPENYAATFNASAFSDCNFVMYENIGVGSDVFTATFTLDPASGAYRVWFECNGDDSSRN
jgi:hypothetical protein